MKILFSMHNYYLAFECNDRSLQYEQDVLKSSNFLYSMSINRDYNEASKVMN